MSSSAFKRPIELLAPARDAATGMEAIRHGADAVYIGANRFGARAAAGNSVEDICDLVQYAHLYNAKVYVTLNTILYDEELEEVRALIDRLTKAGVDALIVQDMGILSLSPSLPLHASTQMDNRTAEKVEWLSRLGFEQVVLARELTLDEIREIHRRVPDTRLEVFVHGAICVSYNGQCYASQHCFRRSANRGECAQFCRLPFDLIDGEGHVLERQKHLLSLRDMNRSAELEALLDAGVTSLKIEGRLKDAAYVKNVTAYYRQRLDEIFRRRTTYCRSSIGKISVNFTPNPAKSFNREFTDYFLHGRTLNLANLATPKSMGEEVGIIKAVNKQFIELKESCSRGSLLSNGDGLCFLDDEEGLVGFRVNRVEGNRLYPANPSTLFSHQALRRGTRLYRNHDHAFEQQLSKPTATRKIGVRWLLKETSENFLLRLIREDGIQVEQILPYPHETARTPQRESVERQLSRLGDTPYWCERIDIETVGERFIPGSLLAESRRALCQKLTDTAVSLCLQNREKPQKLRNDEKDFVPEILSFQYNIANQLARQFYLDQGARQVEPALEKAPLSLSDKELPIMTCRYCIRYQLGMCRKEKESPDTYNQAPLFLRLADGRRFRLHFNCRLCQMTVYTIPVHK